MNRSHVSEHSHKTATLSPSPTAARYPRMVQNSFILLDCERRDLNPHALRHWILSPARLPFRHSRVRKNLREIAGFLKGTSPRRPVRHCDFGDALAFLFGSVQRRELNSRFPQHRCIGYGVATIDDFSLVARQPHRSGPRNAGAFKITNSGASKVVNQTIRHPGIATSLGPRTPEILDSAARLRAARTQRVNKDPRNDRAFGPLNLAKRSRCASKITFRSGVKGNSRPSPFLLSPGSKRSQPFAKSI